MTIIALIPVRFKSTRLPGKPLLKFGDYNMIQRVYLQTIKSKLIDKVYIVTDNDKRIEQSIKDINGNYLSISEKCLNGTERICLALKKYNLNADLIVNVQGDEPFINPIHIDLAIQKMINNNNNKCVCSTLCYHIKNKNELLNPSIGKLVLNKKGNIMYCSRNCIPWNKNNIVNNNCKYYGHIGLFVFNTNYLINEYMKCNTTHQLEEDIEWLKILEEDYDIVCSIVDDEFEIGVNTKEDYDYLLCKYNFS